MPKILLAKPIIEASKAELSEKANTLKAKGIQPRLDVVLVGNNPASLTYVKNKKKRAESIGAQCIIHHLSENVSEQDFLNLVKKIQEDKSVHGCFVQLPHPSQLSKINTHSLIRPDKDVDGFHPENSSAAFSGEHLEQKLIACTPSGIIDMLNYYQISLEGKKFHHHPNPASSCPLFLLRLA